jgi:hypothetical protein
MLTLTLLPDEALDSAGKAGGSINNCFHTTNQIQKSCLCTLNLGIGVLFAFLISRRPAQLATRLK